MIQLFGFFKLLSFIIKDGQIITGRGDIWQIRVCILICQFSIYVKCLMAQLFRFFIPLCFAIKDSKIIARCCDKRQKGVCIFLSQIFFCSLFRSSIAASYLSVA